MHDPTTIPAPAATHAVDQACTLEQLAASMSLLTGSAHALDVELAASHLVAPAALAALVAPDAIDACPVVESLRVLDEGLTSQATQHAIDAALALALQLETFGSSDPELGELVARVTDRARGLGAAEPAWARHARRVEVTRCLALVDAWHVRHDLFLGFRDPTTGVEHVLATWGSLDPLVEGACNLQLLGPIDEVARAFAPVVADDPTIELVELTPGRAGGILDRQLTGLSRGAGIADLVRNRGVGLLALAGARRDLVRAQHGDQRPGESHASPLASVLDAMGTDELLEAFLESPELGAERPAGATNPAARVVLEWVVAFGVEQRAQFSPGHVDLVVECLEGIAVGAAPDDVDSLCRELVASIRAWARFAGHAAGHPPHIVERVVETVDARALDLRAAITRHPA